MPDSNIRKVKRRPKKVKLYICDYISLGCLLYKIFLFRNCRKNNAFLSAYIFGTFLSRNILFEGATIKWIIWGGRRWDATKQVKHLKKINDGVISIFGRGKRVNLCNKN